MNNEETLVSTIMAGGRIFAVVQNGGYEEERERVSLSFCLELMGVKERREKVEVSWELGDSATSKKKCVRAEEKEEGKLKWGPLSKRDVGPRGR